jgi:predicted ABC-type transport system involved in lysophospholipase L1 biosynthesis ATPase subunit
MSEPVLELRSVTRAHGHGDGLVHALDGVSLSVSAGELVAVMGPWWPTLLVTVVLVPALAMALAGLFTRSRLAAERAGD